MRPSVANRPGVLTVDPKTEKEISDLFVTLLRRLGITCLIMTVIGMITTGIAKVDKSAIAPVIFLSILMGITIAYMRGVKLVFDAVMRVGIKRLEEQKFADSAYALEFFHRPGNRNQDSKGEAHYHLLLAYHKLNQMEKADEIADWMERHRKKSEWTEKARNMHATLKLNR